jgi:predicted 3-demethylubiquinone-9 3-methyltransferase (glyoxalase superfamily)
MVAGVQRVESADSDAAERSASSVTARYNGPVWGGKTGWATYLTREGMPKGVKGQAMAKNTICLWYDKDAEAAARFYAETFPNSSVGAVHRAPSDYPSGKQGDVLTVEFTVAGVSCLGLNGGPMFKHNEAFSFQIATDDQQETDRYWNAIVGNGGQESACGWCKDKWGVSWQITPRVLTEALAAGGEEARRAFGAMMGMKKIDVAAIKAARRG